MPRSSTGRVVVDLEPNLKRALYVALASENKTLKEWLVERAQKYISKSPNLDSSDEL